MTSGDTLFTVLLVLDVLALLGMLAALLKFRELALKGQREVQPAMTRAGALAALGKDVATGTQGRGMAMVRRVKSVSDKVLRRVETTRRIAGELRPAAQETALAVKETAAVVQERGAELQRQAEGVQELARRAGRLRSAAQAAMNARRES